jgi:hypothetical protein
MTNPELTSGFDAVIDKLEEMAEAYREMAHGKFVREQWDEFYAQKSELRDSIIMLARKAGAFDVPDLTALWEDANG